MTRRPNEMDRSSTRVAVIALAVVIPVLAAKAAWCQDLRGEPVPILDDGQEPKMMKVGLDFDAGSGVTLASSEVVFEFSRAKIGDPPLLSVQVFDDEGNLAEEFNAWDPRWAFARDDAGAEGRIIREQASGSFMFDFAPDLATADFMDIQNDEELISVDLRPSIRQFCEDNPLDPECEQADLEIVSLGLLAPVPLIAIGDSVDLMVRTTFRNNGPDGPVDSKLIKMATANPGLTVVPDMAEQPEDDLGLGEQRGDDQAYSVRCDAAGVHSVTFASSIELVTVAATDPDLTNNDAELTVSIDCAVPATINIKPGGTPNSINLRAKRGIPVGLLTTSAGQYGNPLAFDATSVTPSSVRFGDRSLVSMGGGATKLHRRAHVEDVFELDNVTLDGDSDLMLHFSPTDTGLTALSIEGCLTGEFDAGGGSTLRFLGCGPVRIVGSSRHRSRRLRP